MSIIVLGNFLLYIFNDKSGFAYLSRAILCIEVKESRSLCIHIYIFV